MRLPLPRRAALVTALLALGLAFAPGAAHAAAGPPAPANQIPIAPVTAAPPVDGKLSDAWTALTPINLGWDLHLTRPAREQTRVYVTADQTSLYVAFDAKQRGPVVASQRTNDIGYGSDDQVEVLLWPSGSSGFAYTFVANPLGTRYEFSSENASFAPRWDAQGTITPDGYVVTMRIPFAVMRGARAATWQAQFVRLNSSTLETDVWTHGAQQSDPTDIVYAGSLTGLAFGGGAAARPRARAALYGLANAAAPVAGGNTTRMGADLSLPITSSTSFFATLHPDFSNVEADQQTIFPTPFRRAIVDYRPFFAQAASFYNPFTALSSCIGCTALSELYTPAIPTPRDGYALEGKQGGFSYAAFDSVGKDRSDVASVVSYHTPNNMLTASVERVAVDLPGLKDETVVGGVTLDNHINRLAYVDFGIDRGSNVGDVSQGDRLESGVKLYGSNWFTGFSLRKVGAYYNPVDGFVSHPDIAGYDVNFERDVNFPVGGPIKNLIFTGELDRYHDHTGLLDQTDNYISAEVNTFKLYRLQVTFGSDYLRLADGTFAPVTQNGLAMNYKRTTDTPTGFAFNQGRFGDATLQSWTRLTTFRLGKLGSLALRGDDTVQFPRDGGPKLTQWLERVTYAYQAGPDTTFGLGIRRLIGQAPTLGVPSPYQNDWNLSAAYHRRYRTKELYIVYGDASAVSTTPQLIFKLIYYVGAEKGV
jgi:hypothetical protein